MLSDNDLATLAKLPLSFLRLNKLCKYLQVQRILSPVLKAQSIKHRDCDSDVYSPLNGNTLSHDCNIKAPDLYST